MPRKKRTDPDAWLREVATSLALVLLYHVVILTSVSLLAAAFMAGAAPVWAVLSFIIGLPSAILSIKYLAAL